MRHLLKEMDKILELVGERQIYLFLDYDGTIAPISKTPDEAKLPETTRKILEEASKTEKIRVSIISGRTLKNIIKMVRIKGIFFAGNHGLEIEGPGMKFSMSVTKKARMAIDEILSKVKNRLDKIPGVLIENKKNVLAFHYRLAKNKNKNKIKSILTAAAGPFLKEGSVKIRQGKEVLEVYPNNDWNKGKAMIWILQMYKALDSIKNPIIFYLGDDTTDKDAFKAVKGTGTSVFVGAPRLAPKIAQYYLNNTEETATFIDMLVKFQKRGIKWMK